MAWINGQWVDDRPGFGGMLGGFGGQPRFAAGYTGDTSLDVIGGPMQPPPFGDRPGMPNLPPQNPFQRPIYGQGPQMQTPFGGGLGNIDQWNPLQPDSATQYQPPQMMPPLNIPGRMPAPVQQPIYDRGPQMQPPMPPRPPVMQPPQVRPPMPPPPPSIGDVWPEQVGPIRDLPPITDLIDTGPVRDRPSDHEFNVAQREKTKARLAQDRAKTKRHYAKLRAKGASKQTIAKAKAKSKARSKKIKGQSLRQRTIDN